jgi:hypothetical protein
MAKTLAFHMNAFRNPLPRPALWHHIDLYPNFDVWGWNVESDRREPGFTVLENVSAAGFRSSVRHWVPDGRLLPAVKLRISTEPAYKAGQTYTVTDVNLDSGEFRTSRQTTAADGRLKFELSGDRHEIGIAPSAASILTVAEWRVAGAPWAEPGKPVRLALRVLNKGSREARSVTVKVASPNPGVRFERSVLRIAALPPGKAVEAGEIVFTVNDPQREMVRLHASFGASKTDIPLFIPLYSAAAELSGFKILDGVRTPLWRRAIQKSEESLGEGNGDGAVQPGETIVLAVEDGEAHRALELFTNDACADLTRRVSDGWGGYDSVGGSAKFTLAKISPKCAGREIPFYARWVEPSKPDHVLKTGVVRVRVQ